MTAKTTKELKLELVEILQLKEHPRNYNEHPDDQLEHIVASIREHGLYRPIVVAKDYTILAGHGVWKALIKMRSTHASVRRLPIKPDSPQALKILTGDNEISHMGIVNDRLLTEILRDIKDTADLKGTGYDEMMLANLVMITRPSHEIADFDAAAHWVGLPEYVPLEEPWKLVVNFDDEEDRKDFAKRLGLTLTEKTKSIWWPPREKDDVSSIEFVSEE
jgi:hypothetical protein